MYLFAVTNTIGPFAISIDSQDWMVAGPLKVEGELPDYVVESFMTTMALNAASLYGQGVEFNGDISPQNFEFTCRNLPDTEISLLKGQRQAVPLDPMNRITSVSDINQLFE